MSYLQTVESIRAAAELVNPNGLFDHGRIVDASQSFRGPFPVIWMYPLTMDLPSPAGVDFIDNNNVALGFWKQDKPASTTEERKIIVSQMDSLARAFLVQLTGNKLIRIPGKIRMEAQYQFHNGTVTGVVLGFQYLNFTPCP